MDESDTTSLIYYGCNLVKDLEAILPSLAENYQPDILVRKCHEIVTIFGNVKGRLSHGEMILIGDHHQSSNVALLQQQHVTQELFRASQGLGESKTKGMHQEEYFSLGTTVHAIGAGDSQGPARSWGGDGSRGLSSQRHRRRRDDTDKRTMRVPAPRMGNTGIPPEEDGHTWRKYGQKDILGSKFPRAYYRCTHQKLYQCPAKKQVQRLDDDPYTFEVTYRGQHACHMYSTAPSIPPPLITEASTQEIAHQRATNYSMELMISCSSMEDQHWEAAEKQY